MARTKEKGGEWPPVILEPGSVFSFSTLVLVCCVCEHQFAGLLPELVAAEVFRDEGTTVFAKIF